MSGLQQSGFVSVQFFWTDLSMCYCSKSADKGQGLAEKKRKENQRGLGTLPYGNFIIRTAGQNDEFRPCVRTWAVLAILVFRHSRRVCRCSDCLCNLLGTQNLKENIKSIYGTTRGLTKGNT